MSISDILFGAAPNYSQNPYSYQTGPDYYQNGMQDYFSNAMNLSQETAPFMPVEPIGLSQSQQDVLGEIYSGNWASSGNGFNFGQQANTAYGNAANSYAGAQPYIQGGAEAISYGDISSGISELLNPYTQNVVDSTTQGLEEQAARRAAEIRGQTNAFGGDRQAIQESDLTRDLMRVTGDVTGDLYKGGYDTALSAAMRNLEGNRNAQQYGANAMMNLGNSQTGLGSNLMSARQTMENIRNQESARNLSTLKARLDASTALYDPVRQEREYHQAINQIPLSQLALQQQALGTIPLGGGGNYQSTPTTDGLLSSGGSVGQGLGNILFSKAGKAATDKIAGYFGLEDLFGGGSPSGGGGGSGDITNQILNKVGSQSLQSFAGSGLGESLGVTSAANALGSLVGIESLLTPASALPSAVAAAGKPAAVSGISSLLGGGGGAAGSAGAAGASSMAATLSAMAPPLAFATLVAMGMMNKKPSRPTRNLGAASDTSTMQPMFGLNDAGQAISPETAGGSAERAWKELSQSEQSALRAYANGGAGLYWDGTTGRFVTGARDDSAILDQGIAIAPGSDFGGLGEGLSGAFLPTTGASSKYIRAIGT